MGRKVAAGPGSKMEAVLEQAGVPHSCACEVLSAMDCSAEVTGQCAISAHSRGKGFVLLVVR